MDLLVYLVEHREEVVPKERLIQAVWPDAYVTDEVLTNTIWKLRQAFGDDPKDPRVIRTIPRRGYQIIAEVVFEEATDIPRIAVLPFDNLSPIPEDEVYSDGLTCSLIGRLSRISSWQVIARTSSMYFKGKDLPLTEIAERLDVEYVLEGSLMKSGDRCSISAQLVRTDNEVSVWSNEYSLAWTDVFEVQREVAQNVVRGVHQTLGSKEKGILDAAPTQSVEAYNAYLKGTYNLNQFINRGEQRFFDEARQFLQTSIDLDPIFVDARAELCWAYYMQYELKRQGDWLERAELASLEAIELQAEKPLAGMVLAAVFHERGELEQALAAYQKSVRYGPSHALSHHGLGVFYADLGFWESAIVEWELANEMNPLYIYSPLAIAWNLAKMGQSEEALGLLRDVLRIEPESYAAHSVTGSVYLFQGQFEGAREVLKVALPELSKDAHPFLEVTLGAALAGQGDLTAALKFVHKLRESPLMTEGYFRYLFTTMCLLSGEEELAMDVIEERPRSATYRELILHPFLESLYKKTRFRTILSQRYEEWIQQVSKYGPSLSEAPPELPTPEEFLRQDDETSYNRTVPKTTCRY
jgi:TolB-like protein/Tfp pilus assembly protein PilF